MTLINCPECGGKVSDQAPACIHCGFPLASPDEESNAPSMAKPAPLHGRAASPSLSGAGSQSARDTLKAEQDALTPDDPVGAAQRAHSERLKHAGELYAEGRFTRAEYTQYKVASEVELRKDLAERQLSRRWDWRRIANFRSRTLRSEFLVAWAIAVVTVLVAAVIDVLLWDGPGVFMVASLGGWIWLYLGASVNRLHDMGHSGWMLLLGLLPFVSLFVLIWIVVAEGETGPNQWGPPVA